MDHLALQADFLRKASPIVDSYKSRINVIEDSVKGNARLALNDFDKATLAIMFDNVDKALLRYKMLKNLSDRTYSETVGPFKKHAFNIISALYTTFDLRDIVSIQPMTQKRGAIYKMVYNFASNKGSVRAGDTMFSPNAAGKRARYYSSPKVAQEPITWTFSTHSTATLEYYPIQKPETISIVVTGGSAAGTYTYLSTSNGNFLLQKDAGGANVGNINSTTGVVTLSSVDATGDTGTVATYTWASEKFSSNSQIPKVTIGVTETEMTAERRNLLIDTMLDVSYDFEAQFAQSLNSEMESTVVQFLQNEVSFRALGEMFDGATGNGGATYNFDPDDCPAGTSLEEYAQVLYKLLATMSTKIRSNVGRGEGNRIICGSNLLNFLRVLGTDKFRRAPKPSGDGPYYAGNLNGDYEIYYNPDLAAADFFMTYKGDSWWQAAYYIGSYLPLMNSQYMLFPDMHGEQGYIGMDAFSLEYPNMIVTGTIEH